jgi:protein TonB
VQAPFATRDIATNNKQIEIIQNTDTGITNPNSTPRNGIENTSPIIYGNTVGTAAILDKLPEFPAGISNFYTYIGKTLRPQK